MHRCGAGVVLPPVESDAHIADANNVADYANQPLPRGLGRQRPDEDELALTIVAAMDAARLRFTGTLDGVPGLE